MTTSGDCYFIGITGEPGRCLATTSIGSPVFYFLRNSSSAWRENQTIICIRVDDNDKRCALCDGIANLFIVGYAFKTDAWSIAKLSRPTFLCDHCVTEASTMELGELEYCLREE